MTVAAASSVAMVVYLLGGYLIGRHRASAWSAPWRAGKPDSSPNLVAGAQALLVAVGAAAPVAVITRSPLLALLGALAAGWWWRGRSHRRNDKALVEFRESWPDGLSQLVAAVRSGATIERAVADVARSGPAPLRSALARYTQLSGVMGTAAALEAVRDSVGDPTTDRVIEVLLVAQEVGGRVVPDILEDMADAVREDLRTVEEIETAGLEQRLNARIVFLVPWLLLGLLTSRAGPYRAFYQSSAGGLVILVAGALSSVAMLVVSHLAREPLEPRVLRRNAPGAT